METVKLLRRELTPFTLTKMSPIYMQEERLGTEVIVWLQTTNQGSCESSNVEKLPVQNLYWCFVSLNTTSINHELVLKSMNTCHS